MKRVCLSSQLERDRNSEPSNWQSDRSVIVILKARYAWPGDPSNTNATSISRLKAANTSILVGESSRACSLRVLQNRSPTSRSQADKQARWSPLGCRFEERRRAANRVDVGVLLVFLDAPKTSPFRQPCHFSACSRRIAQRLSRKADRRFFQRAMARPLARPPGCWWIRLRRGWLVCFLGWFPVGFPLIGVTLF